MRGRLADKQPCWQARMPHTGDIGKMSKTANCGGRQAPALLHNRENRVLQIPGDSIGLRLPKREKTLRSRNRSEHSLVQE